MATIVALVIGEQLRIWVARAIQSDMNVVFCERAAQLRTLVAQHGAAAVLTQRVDDSGRDIKAAILQLHERLPEIPIILLYDSPAPGDDELLALGRAGVSASVNHTTRKFGSTLRATLERAEEQSAGRAIIRTIRSLVPADLQPFVVYCARASTQPLRVEDAARAAGLPPRTLRARMERAGLPSPQRIVRWTRLLHACWRLDVSGRSVKAVAAALGYETDVALRKHSTRLTGLPVSAVLSRGGFHYLLGRFERELRGERPPPEPRR